MEQILIDDEVRDLVAKLEPWNADPEPDLRTEAGDSTPIDASLYRMATMVAGLVAASMTSVMAL